MYTKLYSIKKGVLVLIGIGALLIGVSFFWLAPLARGYNTLVLDPYGQDTYPQTIRRRLTKDGTEGGGNVTTHIVVPPGSDLDVDTDRNGAIDDTLDEPTEELWTNTRGSIFMVNYDDDDGDAMPDAVDFTDAGAPDWDPSTPPSDENIIIDNAADTQDITPYIIRIKPSVDYPAASKAVLSVSGLDQVRGVYMYNTIAAGAAKFWGGWKETNASIDVSGMVPLTGGTVTFGLEGLFFRYMQQNGYGGTFPSGYDGHIVLSLTVTWPGYGNTADTVHLKVAPFIMLPNTQAPQQVWETYKGGNPPDLIPLSDKYGRDIYEGDQWAQDHVEIGYTQAPGRPTQHIVFRLPRAPVQPDWPVNQLLAPGVGVFRFRNTVIFDGADSGDFGGNLEMIPPTPSSPLGKIMVGNTMSSSTNPSIPSMFRFLTDQEVQSPFVADDSWLWVGHIDEIVNAFVGATASIAVADPELAYTIIDALPDDSVFFAVGTSTVGMDLKATATSTTGTILIDTGKDFTDPVYRNMKFVRIFDGVGKGQAAKILQPGGLQNGYIIVNEVWETPTTVSFGPGGAPGTGCVAGMCRGDIVIPKDNRWFTLPDASSRFVLVEDTKYWLDGTLPRGAEVPAIISTWEVTHDVAFYAVNIMAKERIQTVIDKIKAEMEPDPVFVPIPDLFMGEFSAGGIVARSSMAFVPAATNFQPIGDSVYMAQAFGPKSILGTDMLELIAENHILISGANPITIDDWDLYHRLTGQVHCGTVVKRATYPFNWWEKI